MWTIVISTRVMATVLERERAVIIFANKIVTKDTVEKVVAIHLTSHLTIPKRSSRIACEGPKTIELIVTRSRIVAIVLTIERMPFSTNACAS